MSHHSTPHMYNKRTPGSMNDGGSGGMMKGPGVGGNGNNGSAAAAANAAAAAAAATAAANNRPIMDSNQSVSDTQAANAKQLLNAYIYDFLIKSRLPQTAKIFANEAEVPSVPASKSHNSSNKNSPQITNPANSNASTSNSPQIPSSQFHKDNNIPLCNVAMDAPQGFLYEWWQVFWDVFQAKNGASNINKGTSPNMALQYYQLQLLKQRQQQEMQGLNVQAAIMGPGGVPNGGPGAPAGGVGAAAGGQFHPQQNPHPQLLQQLQMQLQMPQGQMLAQGQQGPAPQNQVQGAQGQQPSGQQPQMPQGQLSQQAQQPQPGQPQMPPQGQQPMDPQQQQRLMMQMMMKQQQQQGANQHNMPMGANPLDPQQQQLLANMGPNNGLNLQQQLFLSQQHQQSQNRIQQHAQNQMNNLRQQAAVAAQQQQAAQAQNQPQPHSHDGSSNNSPANGQRMAQMTPQTQQAPAPPMNGMQQFPQQQGMMNGPGSQAPTPFAQGQAPPHIVRMNSVSGKPGIPNQGSPVMVNANNNGANNNLMNKNASNTPNGATANGANRNMNALQDYQMQLMLLEKQNKKRLDIARSNGNAEQGQAMMGNNMIPGQQPQQGLPPGGNQQLSQKASPATATNSPIINNKPSPSSAGGKKKKEPPAKRGRKPSTGGANVQSTPVSNTATNTPSLLKKEYNAPLTPASESQNDLKRKRKSNGAPDSPKKQATSKTGPVKKEKSIKEEAGDDENAQEKKKEEENMPPPAISSNFQDPMAAPDQIFPVEILSGNGAGDSNTFFGTSTQPSQGALDDIDFDFNQFLDGNGDNGLNDGIGGFNWGNVDAIENGE